MAPLGAQGACAAARRAPTYCGIRTRTLTYVRYSTGEQEFYDLRHDPAQLRSRTSGPAHERVRRFAKRRCHDTGLW